MRRSNITYDSKGDSQRLRDSNKAKGKTKALSIMYTVSTVLADMYNPEECYGMSLSNIKKDVKRKVGNKLKDYKGKKVRRVSSLDIYQLLLAIDNADTEISTAYE